MSELLDKKERQIVLFAAVIAAFLAGASVHALQIQGAAAAREWLSAIAPIAGTILALVGFYRAGRSLEFTNKQFSISQYTFLEARAHRFLKNASLVDRYISSSRDKLREIIAQEKLFDVITTGGCDELYIRNHLQTVELCLKDIQDRTDTLLSESQDVLLYEDLSKISSLIASAAVRFRMFCDQAVRSIDNAGVAHENLQKAHRWLQDAKGARIQLFNALDSTRRRYRDLVDQGIEDVKNAAALNTSAKA